jgi:hypothetical protein
MKKPILMALSLNMLFLASCDAGIFKPPTLKIVVEAKNEEGDPVKMVNVVMAGSTSTPSSARREASGFTDADGHYTATIATMDGNVKVRSFFTKGYYKCGNEITVGQKSPNDLSMLATGKWDEGEKTVPLLMRPIKTPVSMYVKKVFLVFPNPGQWTGYDLEIGDWVAPYGKGKVSDLEFAGAGMWESSVEYDGTLTMRIPGEGNGIQVFEMPAGYQRCQFKSPYEAPEDGYLKEWSWRKTRASKGRQFSEITDESFPNRMFIFRVRAEVDEWGRVIKAQYGKIYGPVESLVGNHGKGHVAFTHYLNPDYTRNLEFDPKKNLFPQNPRTDPEYKP